MGHVLCQVCQQLQIVHQILIVLNRQEKKSYTGNKYSTILTTRLLENLKYILSIHQRKILVTAIYLQSQEYWQFVLDRVVFQMSKTV